MRHVDASQHAAVHGERLAGDPGCRVAAKVQSHAGDVLRRAEAPGRQMGQPKVLGPASQVRAGGNWAPFRGELATGYLWGPSYTLQGGSVEILKNIVALRGLGLPAK